jgi:methylamine dehydrogenase accessory protein MauD
MAQTAKKKDTQKEARLEVLLFLLMGIVMLLMLANAGLFLRMNQLQKEVITALAPLRGGVEQAVGLEVGSPAPEFSLADTNGSTVALKDFAGHWVLLGFSSINCSACKATYPHLKAFSENSNDIQVILISRGSFEESQQVAQEHGFLFPVLTMEEAHFKIALDYQVPGTPFFYVLDKKGIIRNAGYANTQEQLTLLVEESVK